MSHYKSYPAYKDSGVEWLGEVPEHWAVRRLKFIASVQTGVAKGKDNSGQETIEVPYLRVANVQDGFLNLDEVSTIEIPVADLQRYQLQPGDVLMNEGGDFDKLGRGHVWQGEIDPCIHQNHVFAVRPTKVSSSWLNAFTSSGAAQFYFMGRAKQSTNLASISSSNLMELPVPLPPVAEREQTLANLTRETIRIDALVDKKTRFMDLLREKRQALITHAVTKGLDPSVKMKDSGVEWLGEVPEHWSVTPLKYIGSSIIGLTYSPENVVDEGDGILVLRSSNIQDGQISLDDNVYVSAVIPAHLRTRIGDILICSRNGSRSLIGKNGLIDSKSEGLTFGAFTTVFRTPHHNFLYYVLNSSLFKFQAGRFLTTTINQLTTETLNSFEIPLPPTEQQASITKHLDRQTTRIDTLIQKTKHSIDLLKERRAALITAAVTGQIDLREAA